jgi:hypothetical protein
MRPIACFQAFFDLLLSLGVSDVAAARIAAGHGLLAIVGRARPIEVARA